MEIDDEMHKALALNAKKLEDLGVITPMPDFEAVRYYWDEESQSVKSEIIPMNKIYRDPIEDAARAGYEHSMKILDFLHPDSQPKFTWETENKSCKDEWREKAKIMLDAATTESDNQS